MFDDDESPELEIIEVRKNPAPIEAAKNENEFAETISQPINLEEPGQEKNQNQVEIIDSDS